MPRATPEFSGRIKYNMVVCDINGDIIVGGQPVVGNYIRMKEFYSEIFIADTTNIFYETNGDTKVIEVANINNGSQNQQWFTKTDPDFLEDLFFEVRLEEGTECLFKAMKYLDFNEAYQVQTSEGSGQWEDFVVQEGTFYVTQEGVDIS